jgi:hypothetical protein
VAALRRPEIIVTSDSTNRNKIVRVQDIVLDCVGGNTSYPELKNRFNIQEQLPVQIGQNPLEGYL